MPEEDADPILAQCLNWHKKFKQEHWQGKASFHDEYHIQSTLEAVTLLIRAARKISTDPLKILADLETWNTQHPEIQITEDEFGLAARLAFACHDLGNILKTTILENNQVEPVFWQTYTAQNAEARSQAAASALIHASKLPETLKLKLLPLVNHLIDQTQFALAEPVPFYRFAKVVDQIGNSLFTTNRECQVGLLEEMVGENPDTEINPFQFFNFARIRFPELLPDETARHQILHIWGKDLPEEKTEFSHQSTKAATWLDQYKTSPNTRP